jgi:uncharacterized protein YifN (PemK superfamily)
MQQPSNMIPLFPHRNDKPLERLLSFSSASTKAVVIDCLTLELHHHISSMNLSQTRYFLRPNTMTVHLGTVISSVSRVRLEDLTETASLPNVEADIRRWLPRVEAAGKLTKDGWTWFEYFICQHRDLT